MKKLLVLGAMQMHIPLLKRAKERGIYTITCDYIPENLGHKYADEAYYDSTTDFEAVYYLTKKTRADGIMTFNSDPAALTAAYVGEQLGLPNSGYSAVKIMSEKDLFREFLKKNNFNYPQYNSYTSLEDIKKELASFNFPILIKPVDSSGSKGVAVVESEKELEQAYDRAISFSRSKRVIVEEFIEAVGPQLHGDGFVERGKLTFCYLGDHHFNKKINNLVPISTTFPSSHSKENIEKVKREVSRFIELVGFKQGGVNIEARINGQGEVFLIEVGPRNGGNFTPIVIQKATNFNFIDAAISVALGEKLPQMNIRENGYFGYLIIHSEKEGLLESIIISPELKDVITEEYIYVQPGDYIEAFRGANTALGVLIVHFDDSSHENNILASFTSLYSINLMKE